MPFSAISSRVGALRDDERGAVAVIFALSLIPLFLVGGAASDYMIANRRKVILQNAVDATALAAAQNGFEQTDAALKTDADRFFAAVAMDPASTIVSATTQRKNDKLHVCIVAEAWTDTHFMRIVGVDSVRVNASSCATAGSASFEVAMALDTSASMAGSKISSLQNAAQNFVNTMFGPTMGGSSVRISVVPFNHNVAVETSSVGPGASSWVDLYGASPYHWGPDFSATRGKVTSRFDVFTRLAAFRSSYAWKGCFQALPYPLNTQEIGAGGGDPAGLLVPSLEPDSPDPTANPYGWGYNTSESLNDYIADLGPGCIASDASDGRAASRACKYVPPKSSSLASGVGPNSACGSKPLQRLTSDKSALLKRIGELSANGYTNIHQGVWWAWSTLSPRAGFKDGADYTKPENLKVMIVMTDGDNTWAAAPRSALFKSNYSAYGYYTNVKSDNLHYAQPSATVDGNSLPTPNGSYSAANERNARAMMNDLTSRTCANIRAAGVTIYSIAFVQNAGDISAEGQRLLQDCAGDPSRYFVGDSSTISAVFGTIASAIGKLRLSE